METANGSTLYIAFLATPTGMGRLIRFATKNIYNHVAVSFDPELKKMYSFARYRENTPLAGGFVEESALRYGVGGRSALVKLCAVPLDGEKFSRIYEYVSGVRDCSVKYIYNSVSALSSLFRRRVEVFNAMTCLEFSENVLAQAGITYPEKKPFSRVRDLEELLEEYAVYEGIFNLPAAELEWGRDTFPQRAGKIRAVRSTLAHFGVLIKRMAGRV